MRGDGLSLYGDGDHMLANESVRTAEVELSAPVSEARNGRHPGIERRPVWKVWIDLENSPHVPFFRPIMKELEKLDCKIVLTARDCFQVCELADMAGLKYEKIGRHYGKNRIAKLIGLAIRVLQMTPFILREKPAISVSHGSRSLMVLSGMLGIRSINIADYEYADHRLTTLLGSVRKKWIMTPEVIPAEIFEKDGMLRDHILHYPGIKEDVYVPFFQPNPALKDTLGLQSTDVVVTIRPPATEAHYHNPESEKLLMAVFELLDQHPEVKTVLLPRTHKQEIELRHARPELFDTGKIVVPKHAVDGLDLIWYSDVVISGGGTMNREAAALGIPVYSLFRGTMGAVDKHLAEIGKLVLLESEQDVREKLKLVRRTKMLAPLPSQRATLEAVVNHISAILENEG
jgi:predicted glycosyltransferase